MNFALRVLKGATIHQVAEPPPPLLVPIPAPELRARIDDAEELVCAKAAETGCSSEGMASKHWWNSRKGVPVCCRCKEAYQMSAGYRLGPRGAPGEGMPLSESVSSSH